MTPNSSKTPYIAIIVVVIVILSRFVHPFSCNNHHPVQDHKTRTERPADRTERPSGGTESSSNTQQGNDDGLNRNENHLVLTRHARCRMECRHITEVEIKEILHDGKINYNKSELHGERGPKYALEGYLPDKQHLRVIFAPETNAVVVITCIDLDNEWQCPSCN